MHTLIIGHRGTGKSALLKRLARYFPDGVFLCLDEEIEKEHGSIKQIFKNKGEPEFRKLEREVFAQLLTRFKEKVRPVYISLGAGFDGALPKDWEVLYLQRDVRVQDFVFPDRPNLGTAGLRMPLEIFQLREKKYQQMATQELTLLEGEVKEISEEKEFFSDSITHLGGIITLLPHHVDSVEFKYWARRRIKWGLHAFEARDDLLSQEQLGRVVDLVSKEHLVISFRNNSRVQDTLLLSDGPLRVDWPLEFGEVSKNIKDKTFYSLHSEEGEWDKHWKIVESFANPIKWAPIVKDLKQLRQGHEWFKKNPQQRSFLPRSPSGRWVWYRLLTKNQMPIQFLREGVGSSPDQPTLLQWLARGKDKKFAAIIGSPVKHSWTPLFHKEFFKAKGVDTLALNFSETELDKLSFGFLQELGFKAFAVTSPLKKWAGTLVKSASALNTLVLHKIKLRWEGFNTDDEGFKILAQEILKNDPQGANTAVWGGGGVLDSVRQVLPKVASYSARSGQPRAGESVLVNPKYVIWAAGNKAADHSTVGALPPSNWKPQVLFDLSYTHDSAGIEYAHQVGARYVSGQAMFEAQAVKQQEIWKRYEF